MARRVRRFAGWEKPTVPSPHSARPPGLPRMSPAERAVLSTVPTLQSRIAALDPGGCTTTCPPTCVCEGAW